MKLKILNDINVKNKLVLLRADINSPVVKKKIIDNPRFKASAETIKELLNKKAKLTIIAHQGRKDSSDFLSLKQHAEILSKYVKSKIKYIDDLFGDEAGKEIQNLKEGKAVLLKNVRSYEDEILPFKKDNHYAQLCKLFDIYVNDAFSVSHRAQGSVILPPKYLPSVIGRQFEKELYIVEKFKLLKNKKIVLVLGGAKVQDYVSLFKLLNYKQNKVLAAGVLANLFLIVKGYNLGYENTWLKENNYYSLIPQLAKLYKKYKKQIVLPIDFGLKVEKNNRQNVSLIEMPFRHKIYDVDKKTVELFKKELKDSNLIFMKGPLGFSEIPKFSYGTVEILKYLSSLTKSKKIITLLGGGHLTTTIEKYKLKSNFSHVSLSGGALIQYISGEKLPGLEALKRN